MNDYFLYDCGVVFFALRFLKSHIKMTYYYCCQSIWSAAHMWLMMRNKYTLVHEERSFIQILSATMTIQAKFRRSMKSASKFDEETN